VSVTNQLQGRPARNSKQFHGVVGANKAKSLPFRLNGRNPKWAAIALGAHSSPAAVHGGSRMARGIYGGLLAAKATGHGVPLNLLHRSIHALEAAPTVNAAAEAL
jgi:hypothetical protein